MLQNSQENICVGVSCLLKLQVYTFYRIPLGSYFESKMQYSVLISLRWFFFKFIVNLYHWLKSKVDLDEFVWYSVLNMSFLFYSRSSYQGRLFLQNKSASNFSKVLEKLCEGVSFLGKLQTIDHNIIKMNFFTGLFQGFGKNFSKIIWYWKNSYLADQPCHFRQAFVLYLMSVLMICK